VRIEVFGIEIWLSDWLELSEPFRRTGHVKLAAAERIRKGLLIELKEKPECTDKIKQYLNLKA
jgi:hypothetical protein